MFAGEPVRDGAVDADVLASGLLSPFDPPERLMDALQTRRLRLAVGDRIEAERRTIS